MPATLPRAGEWGFSARATIFDAQVITVDTTSQLLSLQGYTRAVFYLKTTAASGTSPTLVARIQMQLADGVEWHDIATSRQVTTGTAKEIIAIVDGGPFVNAVSVALAAGTTIDMPFGSRLRVVLDVGGTNPSFTTSLWVEAARV